MGVSHCCDYPVSVHNLPRVTSSVVDASANSASIDQTVREHLSEQAALYMLDTDLLERLQPDLLVTQALCDVCAVSGDDVEAAIRNLPTGPQVINLEPFSLDDVLETIKLIGGATNRQAKADQQLSALRGRIEAVRDRTRQFVEKPVSVLLLDWFDPLFVSGHWMEDLIEIAGGRSAVDISGVPSRSLGWQELEAAGPDHVILSCCGFTADRTRQEITASPQGQAFIDGLAARNIPLDIVDGNSLFARPGPRLVESVELLAHLLHPEIHPAADWFDEFR